MSDSRQEKPTKPENQSSKGSAPSGHPKIRRLSKEEARKLGIPLNRIIFFPAPKTAADANRKRNTDAD